jgi:putative membrane protein
VRDIAVIGADGVVAPGELAGAWTFQPALVVGLVLTAGVYARGVTRLGRRITGVDRAVRVTCFSAGLVVVAAALASPLDALASALFSAHMVQHLLLMVVAAPLLVYARPAAALVAGLPAGGRDVARATASGGLRGIGRAATRPVVVWSLGALALWAWHMPSLYEGALEHDVLHVAEHASFLVVSLLFWHVVLSSGTRRGVARPVAALLVFAAGVQGTALGAVLLFASTPLYPAHDAGAALWGRSPLADQQLAGSLMWGIPAVVYVVTVGWLLFRWFAEMDDEPSPDPLLVAAGEGL